ncbi:MAG: hypothetical protein ACLRSG_07695 [Christensenellales bacterium]
MVVIWRTTESATYRKLDTVKTAQGEIVTLVDVDFAEYRRKTK